MRRHLIRAGWGVLLGMVLSMAPLAWSHPAASVVVPLTLAQLVEAADLIVDGTIEDVRVVAGPDGAERMVLVRGAAAAWKGEVDGPVYVRLAGGRLGTTETRVPGVPAVADGERYAWFLVAHPRGGYSVVGLYQGALRVTAGPDGGLRVLAPATTAGPRGDVARLPRPIEEIEAQVRTLLAGGQP
ncbi:hypothetical protein TBR22_A19750 [Luteitalea sp. TBR-22]|uniref:hypothetical protein n=1 Tax=Luteitalea sp. TBR-22 TaxID=2802971 RepID=UPI001AF30B94|nr:hypothetical protein [Luteitalea sp. TBR-22]BCS32753.1 hypothetical protein TBR22_A19750 [Luteitalea sp. TBR-22]